MCWVEHLDFISQNIFFSFKSCLFCLTGELIITGQNRSRLWSNWLPTGQLKHILCWRLIGVLQSLRNMLGKTVRPSICISIFISTGTDTRNGFSFFTFILSCKYLLCARKNTIDRFLFIFWYFCVALGKRAFIVRIEKILALNYKVAEIAFL